jgi:hypothetical protein
MLWDDIRQKLGNAEAEVFTKDDYWELVDLINDYGYAMQVAGIRGEVDKDNVERVLSSVMGAYDYTPRPGREKYNYGG